MLRRCRLPLAVWHVCQPSTGINPLPGNLNPKLCGVCAIFLRLATHIINAHHQHLIATNNAATLGCTLLLKVSVQNGAQREAT